MGEVRLRETEGRRSLTIHACFLRVGRGIESPAPTWRKRAFLKTPIRSTGCYLTLNQAENFRYFRPIRTFHEGGTLTKVVSERRQLSRATILRALQNTLLPAERGQDNRWEIRDS